MTAPRPDTALFSSGPESRFLVTVVSQAPYPPYFRAGHFGCLALDFAHPKSVWGPKRPMPNHGGWLDRPKGAPSLYLSILPETLVGPGPRSFHWARRAYEGPPTPHRRRLPPGKLGQQSANAVQKGQALGGADRGPGCNQMLGVGGIGAVMNNRAFRAH